MHRRFLRTVAVGSAVTASVIAGTVASSGAAQSSPAAYVRVEGARATLLPQTLVRTQPGNRVEGHPCPAASAAGALDDATSGKWSGSYSTQFNDYEVGSILGEKPSGANDYWTLWLNGRTSSTGACETPLRPGDHVLWFVCHGNPNPPYNCTNNPLAVTAPAVVQRGHGLTAHVAQIDGAGHSSPIDGATLRGGHLTATSNASGAVRLTPHTAGTITLQARGAGATASDPVYVCVYVHHRSECGNAGRPPAVHIAGIAEHEVFARARAPRELRGAAGPDPAGLTDVSFGLYRRAAGGRCSYYDAERASFRSAACGTAPPLFSIGASGSWSYFLPRALAPGRYVLEVIATDGANRHTRLLTGRSRLDFTVR